MAVETCTPSAPGILEKRVPLTDAQREIWYVSQMSEGASLAYNESLTLRLTGPLSLGALRRALRLLVARHEALRTRIGAAGDMQRILAAGEIDLVVEDLASSEAGAAASAAAWLERHVAQPFKLVDAPLFRAALLRVDEKTHFLALIVHHVICDGWSLGLIARELGQLYAAEKVGKAAKLAPAPALSAYVERLGEERNSRAFAVAREYWQSEFAQGSPVLDLPTDRTRPTERTYAGALATRVLPARMVEDLKGLCAKHDCTTFTALFAGFGLLVHRLSGQDDIVIGVPSAAQVMAGEGALVGHFANLLAIRSDIADNPAFSAYLARVRKKLGDGIEQWRFPFGNLLQHLNLPRDPSRVPLAPVVFNTTGRHGALEFGGLEAAVEPAPKPFVNFDLNVHFGIAGETVTLGCYYSTELFEAATIERWFDHLETLFRAIAATPEAPVKELALLDAAERQRILCDWNKTELPYRSDATIAQLFEEQVQRTPDAPALVAGAERLSYAELDRRAELVAAGLRADGIGPESIVGIFLERTPHLLAAMLGVLKAGGAYLPLDPSHPSQRLTFMLEDTKARAIVTERKLAANLPATTAKQVVIDAESASESSPARGERATSSNLAYVIYTSGSTGQPKGVCLEHRGVAALVAWAAQHYQREELDGVLFATAASFDVSVFESLVPLCLGGKLILAENILALADLPAANEVRLISGVPSAVAELLRMNALPASVTTVNVAGEPCPQSLVEALYQRAHLRRVIDVYGPTETTVYSTGSVRRAGGKATIGRPLPNERAYILDSRLQPVPVGVRGELFIGGEKLARGYLNRPELTAEKFLADPFVEATSARSPRMYRTGDAARFLPDGSIEFLGRLDHQVKIRGYRIELGEIEGALLRQTSVAEAVVVARPESGGGQQLVAYVVAAPGADCAPQALRDALLQRLPSYMVPAHVVVLAELPRTTSGKVDRRALPAPGETRAGAPRREPSTTTEQVLADVWREVLGLEAVGIDDNFFELGGHSLLATQVITRVHELFGVELTLKHLFAAPCIAALAATIESALIDEIQAAEPARDASDARESFLTAKE